jgi:hypothetical protein
MDQHYSECDKHKDIFWHTITYGEDCPLCKIKSLRNLPQKDRSIEKTYDMMIENIKEWYNKYFMSH